LWRSYPINGPPLIRGRPGEACPWRSPNAGSGRPGHPRGRRAAKSRQDVAMRTREEQQVIDLVAQTEGAEWAESHAALILAQARAIGNLEELEAADALACRGRPKRHRSREALAGQPRQRVAPLTVATAW
jgi:hypothetical protein